MVTDLSDSEVHSLEIYVDGACIPKNPGGTPVWGCFFMRDKEPVDIIGGLAGVGSTERATNSTAEYAAIVNALKEAKRRGWDKDNVTLYTDSQFLHGQIELGKKVRTAHLVHLNKKALELKAQFLSLKIVQIPREKNKVAHRAAWTAFLEWEHGKRGI